MEHYGAQRGQPGAISGKLTDRRNRRNKPKPLLCVATSCAESFMVSRGSSARRFVDLLSAAVNEIDRPGKGPCDGAARESSRQRPGRPSLTPARGFDQLERHSPAPAGKHPDRVEPFEHRKALPGLRQEKVQIHDFLAEVLEHAFAGMCSSRTPTKKAKPRTFPLQIARADARTRTGDSFITSYGRVSRCVIASHFRPLCCAGIS
jgi:hypothetical protein